MKNLTGENIMELVNAFHVLNISYNTQQWN